MRKFLFWITGKLPCRIISDGDEPYLERYYLCTFFGVRFYLHRFVASDPDCGLHDHPWRWAFSILLSGWYAEETRYGLRNVRWFNRLSGDTFHRVILKDGPVWTLFMHRARREKPWGFLRNKGQLGTVYVQHHYRKDETGRDEQWWHSAPRGADEPFRLTF